MTKEQADVMAEKYDYIMKEDAGRGYRRVVASPKPQEIIEIGTIRNMVDSGDVVIACGGGGIPVTRQGNHLKGASAVIDKDFASCLMAKELDADFLIILTAVEKAAINYGKPNEKWLGDITVAEAKQYIDEGHFAPGSMLPKVQDSQNQSRADRLSSHCLKKRKTESSARPVQGFICRTNHQTPKM